MLVHELTLDQFDIGFENSFELDEYLQCLEELGLGSSNYQKSIWIRNEFFLKKSEMI